MENNRTETGKQRITVRDNEGIERQYTSGLVAGVVKKTDSKMAIEVSVLNADSSGELAALADGAIKGIVSAGREAAGEVGVLAAMLMIAKLLESLETGMSLPSPSTNFRLADEFWKGVGMA